MLGDLLDKLRNISEIVGIIVVTPDPRSPIFRSEKGHGLSESRNREA